MSRAQLSRLGDYELVNKNQDIRGWEVKDLTGKVLGTVADMIVDTDKERVTAILLDNRVEYSVYDIEIADHVILLAEGSLPIAAPLDSDNDNEMAAAPSRSTQEELRLPVVEEKLRIGKREVDQGGVRVVRRIAGRPVQEDVRLREEFVDVQRRPVDKPLGPAAAVQMRDFELEVAANAEVPVVAKEARVVEEVVVKKEATERREKVREVVRRKDVEVQPLETDPKNRTRPNAPF